MNRFLKISLITLSVTIILIVGFVIYFIAFSDQNTYKPLISEWVKDKTQRELKLNGDIKLTFSPQIGITLNHISLSEYQSDKEFATVEHVFLSLSLQPLLSRQLVIDEITMQGFKGLLIRFKDGRMNIDDLIAPDDESTQFKFYIDQVRVENAALFFHDAKSERHYALSDLNLKTGNITNASLDNLEFATKGNTTNFAKNNEYDFEIKLDIPNLQFSADNMESGKVSLITRITHQKNWFNGKFTLSNISYIDDQFKSDLMAIELVSEKEAQIAKTHLSSPIVGNLETQQLNLPDIKVMLSLSTPNFPDHPIGGILQGNLAVTGLAKNIRANLVGNIEDSHIKAKFNVLGFKKPAFNVVIDIDQLNMDRLLPKSHKETQKINQIKNKQQIAAHLNERLNLSALTDLNTNGSIRIGLLRSGDITLSGIQFEILSDTTPLFVDPTR